MSRKCIMENRRCDKYPDCEYGEDEANCQVRETVSFNTCRLNEFECSPDICIHESWVCDGREDCRNGKDEASCGLCRPDNEFQCRNGDCIDSRFLCDQRPDCRDGSDESAELCIQQAVCPPGNFQCDGKKCIPDERVCNGFLDCLDQTDEFQCNDLRRCNGDQFQCDNGECIPQSYKCDNFNDCDRGEDERVCAVTQIVPVNTRRPSPPEININTKCDFQCWDGMCQPWEARCNGANDCLKGEDEMKCHNSNPAGQQPSPIMGGHSSMGGSDSPAPIQQASRCAMGEHQCDNGDCLPAAKRCNYVYDCCLNLDRAQAGTCRDWSDEEGC